MRLGTVMALTGLLGGLFGLAYLLAPTALLGFFGIDAGPGTVLAARFFGASVFGYATLAWLSRNANPAEDSTRAIEMSLAVASGLACVLSIVGVTTGVFNVYGWGAMLVFLVLAGSFAYLRAR